MSPAVPPPTGADGSAVPPTQPGEAEPELQARLEHARAFTSQLLRGLKQIALYRHDPRRFPELLVRSADALLAYTEAHGPLVMRVEQQNFLLAGQPLLEESSPLPYKFFRDGIRQLLWRPGLTVEELVSFSVIALSEPERGGEDLIAQLWRANLEHLEYVVVEGFRMDEVSEEEVQVEVDKIVSYLHGRLRSGSEDYLRFARVSTEDLDAKLDGVEQIRGLVVTGTTADPALKARVQREIQEEESSRLFPKLVSAVFQVVESGVDDADLLEDMFIQLLDAMLLQEDFATINQVCLKLRAMEQRAGPESGVARLREAFVVRMGEEQRIARIGEILRTTRPRNAQDIVRYLQALSPTTIPLVLTVLETIDIQENRTLLCDLLAPFANEFPEPFVNRLGSDRPQTVRDMVYILEKTDLPDRIRIYAPVLHSPNLAMRLEVMHLISRARSEQARKAVAECLEDPHPQVRMLAARLLPEFDRDKAYIELARIIREPAFEKRSPEEKAQLYQGLGSTGNPAAVSLFTQLLAMKPNLFNKGRILEEKLLAIQGLQGVCSIQSYKLLQEVAEDRTQPPELLSAARKAAYVTRKALFGQRTKDGDPPPP